MRKSLHKIPDNLATYFHNTEMPITQLRISFHYLLRLSCQNQLHYLQFVFAAVKEH
jgi:hypothetical protein